MPEHTGMRIGVVGAGVAGLVTAKVLRQAGHDVVVVDKADDVGGVWSASRRYPGLTTQSTKQQYTLSDFAMPDEYPEWPTGEQVQRWLASYATHFGLDEHIRLGTEVTSARASGDGGWTLATRQVSTGDTDELHVDRLVAANGVFSEPNIPDFAGVEEFTAAGGEVVAGNALVDAERARDRHALVVGYGKSANDVTVPISQVAASTHVIARTLHWKVPRLIAGKVNFKMLLLTRMGEALFRYLRLGRVDRFLHGPGNPVRRRMLNSLGSISAKQYGLRELDLVPPGQMEDIVRGAIGLATEGFFEGVRDGTIDVRAGTTIRELTVRDGAPHAVLDDGTVLPADLVVCATGYVQEVPFLAPEVRDALLDDAGNFQLYRQILPLDVEGLYFNGYNSSFFSPLNAELAAVWIAAHLEDQVDLPPREAMRRAVTEQIAFMDDATDGHHQRGTKIIPFSMKNADEVLGDLDLQIPARVRASHWLNPVDPAAYADVTPRMVARLEAARSARPDATAATAGAAG